MADIAPSEIGPLWTPKWSISEKTRIATIGSCFAQHFGVALRQRGYAWLNGEPAPSPLPAALRRTFGYELFSVRTGNVYTPRQFLQWLQWSVGSKPIPQEVWVKDGRYYDPFRPSIEPNGFCSREELVLSRRSLLASLLDVMGEADILVFTLGLTECWRNRESDCEYQSAPGIVAGVFDPTIHRFHNQTYSEIAADLRSIIDLLKAVRGPIKVLLTVSPVPLTATASGRHVLAANTYSKSVLRGVAGEIETRSPDCDYFPAYELITSSPFRSMFFAPNLRTIAPLGVNFVMDYFFKANSENPDARPGPANGSSANIEAADPVCDDAALEAFARL